MALEDEDAEEAGRVARARRDEEME